MGEASERASELSGGRRGFLRLMVGEEFGGDVASRGADVCLGKGWLRGKLVKAKFGLV